MFNNAESINFRGKEVKKIVRLRDNAILYQMEDNHLEFTFTKKQIYIHGLTGSNMIIDYGNGDIGETTGELIEYNYNTLEDETHIVKIYGVTGLGYESFKECHGLTDMTIPSTVTSIGEYCFTDCDHLENINIPSSITSLPRSCFMYCTGLLNIDIPSSITSIGGSCFYSCSSLVSIDIPSSITSIGGSCFFSCISLEEINLNWTTLEDIVSYQSNWITRANANLKFIIPEGTTDLYIEKGYPSDKLVEISEDETIDVSVSVSYRNDSNNQDGNRPTEIPIELIVSGTIVIRTATLTPENNWSYTFSDLEDGISYQLSASEIDFYDLDITKNNNDFTIIADYLPPLTNATVQVTFDDVIPDYRPQSITATLNNGTEVNLTNNNSWSANISNLPAVVNHETATYDWTIAQVPHYEIFQKTKNGNVTNFILKQLDNIPASITLEKTDGEQILSYVDRQTLPVMTEFCELTATVIDENNNPLSNAYIDFYKNDELWIDHISTDSNGQVTIPYYSEGVGDVEIYAKIGDLVTETYAIEDCNYYRTTEYSSESSLDISLPNQFKLEFDIKPTNRSTSSGGNNGYIRIGEDASKGVWVGQMTSGGYHGIILKSSTTATYCPTITNLDWNHIIVTFDGATVSYTCNNETVTVSASNLPKINGLVATTYEHLKNIKIKPLQSIDISVDNPILSYADGDTATLTATVNPIANGKIVKIYKDDILVATKTTDSQGQVSYEYESQGNGDTKFKFKYGSVTENLTIEDAVLYTPNISTISVTSQNIPVGGTTESRLCLNNPIDLPSAFVMSGTVKRLGSSNQQVLIGCGENKDTMYEFPVLRSNGNMTFRKNATNTLLIDEYAFPTNTDVPFSYTYDGNGNHTLSVNNVSRTVTSSEIDMDKFISLQLGSNGRLSNLKIKPIQSININVDNPVLSYADNTQANPQTTTLTATVNPIESGKTVQIYQDDVLIATEQTDSQGQVSYEYTSQGVGDIEFEFKCGSVTENYTIQDCLLYKPTLPTGDSVLIDISNVIIPTNFKAIFNVKQLRNTSSMGGLFIGSNSTNRILFGKIGSNGYVGIYVYKNGSTVTSIHQENVYQNNQVSETVYTYNNGVQTITANGVTKQITNSSITDRSYMESNITTGGAEITKLKIKPL